MSFRRERIFPFRVKKMIKNSFAPLVLISLYTSLFGCTSQESDFSDVACLEQAGKSYYADKINAEDIISNCQIEHNELRISFLQSLQISRSYRKGLDNKNDPICLVNWNSMLLRAWHATTSKISEDKGEFTNSEQEALVYSAIFDSFLTNEAYRGYKAAGNTDISPLQCASLYSLVALERELGFAKLMALEAQLPIRERTMTKTEIWAAWFVVLHADSHPDIQEKFEPFFIELSQIDGRFDGHNAALLSDRISLRTNSPLKYGVLYDCVNGEISHKIDDVRLVNERRKTIKIESYEEWKRIEIAKGYCE